MDSCFVLPYFTDHESSSAAVAAYAPASTGVTYSATDDRSDSGTALANDFPKNIAVGAAIRSARRAASATTSSSAGIIGGGGEWPGVAPGVSIMPVRVLDEYQAGSELGLIDGIYWAVEHGAHVINMSLSFSPWYVPSRALDEAIAFAWDSGVVLVAAAGNHGSTFVSWPAADPRVIAVGAAQMDPREGVDVAPYSNIGPAIDICAPGGNIDLDANDDDIPDGIVNTSFPFQQPGSSAPLAIAGTSQAAAVVSGAAVRLLAAGAEPDELALLLQASADDTLLPSPQRPFQDGFGAGLLDLAAALDLLQRQEAPRINPLQVRILPFLLEQSAPGATQQVAIPSARVWVWTAQGEPAHQVDVVGLFGGDQNEIVSCTTQQGTCLLHGPAIPISDASGAILPLAWGFTVDAIVTDGLAQRPWAALPGGPCFQEMSSAMELHPLLNGHGLAFWWSEQQHPVLGRLAESGVVLDVGGPGASTRPFAALFTPTVLQQVELGAQTLSLPGQGLTPCGAHSVETLFGQAEGPGFLATPLLFANLDPVDAVTEACLDTIGLSATPSDSVIGSAHEWATAEGKLLASAMVGGGVLPVATQEFGGVITGTGALELR